MRQCYLDQNKKTIEAMQCSNPYLFLVFFSVLLCCFRFVFFFFLFYFYFFGGVGWWWCGIYANQCYIGSKSDCCLGRPEWLPCWLAWILACTLCKPFDSHETRLECCKKKALLTASQISYCTSHVHCALCYILWTFTNRHEIKNMDIHVWSNWPRLTLV